MVALLIGLSFVERLPATTGVATISYHDPASASQNAPRPPSQTPPADDGHSAPAHLDRISQPGEKPRRPLRRFSRGRMAAPWNSRPGHSTTTPRRSHPRGLDSSFVSATFADP